MRERETDRQRQTEREIVKEKEGNVERKKGNIGKRIET